MIRVDGLSHYFFPNNWDFSAGIKVLDKIDLTLHSHTFISFLGPSGCGKTTLLRIIGGLIEPVRGKVWIENEEVRGPNAHCAMVFQEFNLFPWRTALANVEFPLEIRGVPPNERREKALDHLNLVGLSGFESHYPHQLSGGMKQRVGLARALVTEADYLLMDEPFGALDPQIRELMQVELLKIWEKTNTTVVFVTHDIGEAIFLSDTVITFSSRPGHVKSQTAIDLPRPRNTNVGSVRSTMEFTRYRDMIWDILRPEVAMNSDH